jgi:hypothetical protein
LKETQDTVIERNTSQKKELKLAPRDQAKLQFERFYSLFRKFHLNALAILAAFENKIKSLTLNNLTNFNKIAVKDF